MTSLVRLLFHHQFDYYSTTGSTPVPPPVRLLFHHWFDHCKIFPKYASSLRAKEYKHEITIITCCLLCFTPSLFFNLVKFNQYNSCFFRIP